MNARVKEIYLITVFFFLFLNWLLQYDLERQLSRKEANFLKSIVILLNLTFHQVITKILFEHIRFGKRGHFLKKSYLNG